MQRSCSLTVPCLTCCWRGGVSGGRYCTKTCKVVFAQFDSAVTGAKAPTCQEYAVVAAILTRELSLARRECKNPVAVRKRPGWGGGSHWHVTTTRAANAGVVASRACTARCLGARPRCGIVGMWRRALTCTPAVPADVAAGRV